MKSFTARAAAIREYVGMASPDLTPRFSDEQAGPPEGFPPPASETVGSPPTGHTPPDEVGDVFNSPPLGAMPEDDDPWT